MRFMLDTNICIYIINHKPQKVLSRFKLEEPGEIVLSSLTLAELKFGAYNSSNEKKNLEAISKFTAPMDVLSFGEEETEAYGKIRASLKKSGKMIGPMDLLIAAHAVSSDCVLVTNNLKEYKNVEGIQLENWA